MKDKSVEEQKYIVRKGHSQQFGTDFYNFSMLHLNKDYNKLEDTILVTMMDVIREQNSKSGMKLHLNLSKKKLNI